MLFEISAVEIGQHFYWSLNGFQVHGQVLINTWIVCFLILVVAFSTTRNIGAPTTEATGAEPMSTSSQLTGGQNFIEFVLEFIRDIAKTQIEHDSLKWVPFIGTLFLFIFVSNWSGALVPWRIFELPNGELGAPTNDINTTVA